MADRSAPHSESTPATLAVGVTQAVTLLAAALLAGCSWDAPPVEWAAPTPLMTAVDSSARYTARLAATGGMPAVIVERAVPAPPVAPPQVPSACPGSWVSAAPVRGTRWSAWWQIRPDSSAVLMSAQQDSTGAMLQRIAVDTIDVALLGCARPAPAIAVDSVNGYVHVAYFMVAKEGPGLFYSHLMDTRLRHFERPIAIVYGEKPSRIDVASRGDTMAVVYEDPNSELGRIAMSLSLTSGHLFEQTARLIPVSTSSQEASSPQVVKLAGGQVWVGWKEESASGSAFLLRQARIVTR